MGAATAGAVFYCNASMAAILFWRLAASWRPLMLQWADLERRLCATWPTPSGARWRALAIASTVLILASGIYAYAWKLQLLCVLLRWLEPAGLCIFSFDIKRGSSHYCGC
jgi:hypothetical protein